MQKPDLAESRSLLRKFYSQIATELPEGYVGRENAYPVRIGNENLEVVLFGLIDAKVTFGLFVRNPRPPNDVRIFGQPAAADQLFQKVGKYARKTIEISSAGEVTEDATGSLPDFDLTDREPDFSGTSNEQLAVEVIRQIGSFERKNTN